MVRGMRICIYKLIGLCNYKEGVQQYLLPISIPAGFLLGGRLDKEYYPIL